MWKPFDVLEIDAILHYRHLQICLYSPPKLTDIHHRNVQSVLKRGTSLHNVLYTCTHTQKIHTLKNLTSNHISMKRLMHVEVDRWYASKTLAQIHTHVHAGRDTHCCERRYRTRRARWKQLFFFERLLARLRDKIPPCQGKPPPSDGVRVSLQTHYT